MSMFIDACNAIEDELLQVGRECEFMLVELSTFENHVACLPTLWMKLRLLSIALQIKVSEASLYQQHDGKGLVFVGLTETAFVLTWYKGEELFDNKYLPIVGSMHPISVEEGLDILRGLESKVDSGSLVEAIEWMNHHVIMTV